MNMKKKLLSAFVAISLLGSPAAAWAAEEVAAGAPAAESAAAAYSWEQLNDQAIMSVLWMQRSAEYRALCYQAYNMVRLQARAKLAQHRPGDKPLAIVLDCDETIIDNSAFDAAYIGRDIYPYASLDNVTRWEEAGQGRAMPGAVALLQELAAKDIAIFYVTDRVEKTMLAATLRQFAALGLPSVDLRHVLLKNATSGHGKQGRFDAIARDYDVIVWMGDNENDLPIGSYGKDMAARQAAVDAQAADFGTLFVMLPNPAYGSWESALAPGYAKMTAQQQNDVRRANLAQWDGVR